MRICQVLDKLSTGGVEVQFLSLLPQMRALGAEVEVCTLKSLGPFAGRLQSELGVPITLVETSHQLRPQAIKPLANFFRTKQFDVVHSHLYWSNIPATAAARMARVPAVVAQWHNQGNYGPRWLRVKEWAMMPFRDALITVHKNVSRDIGRATWTPPGRFQVLASGVDLAAVPSRHEALARRGELGLAESDFLIAHVARLHAGKNHQAFLRAFPRILAEAPHCLLVLVGDGPDQASLELLVKELGIGSRVRFLGMRTDPLHWLAACDISIMPSVSEGFANIQLESIACGAPVVTMHTGFLPDVARDGEDAFVVPLGDMDEFAKRVVTLALDPGLRQRMSANGRRLAADYGVDAMARNIMGIYEKVLVAKGRMRGQQRVSA